MRLAWLPCCALACISTEDRSLLMPEHGQGTQTIVVATRVDDAVVVRVGEASSALRWFAMGRAPQEAVVLHFDASPEDLSLPIGIVPPSEDGCGVRGFSHAQAMFTADLSAADPSFVVAREMPEWLRSFQFATPCPCLSFDVTPVMTAVSPFSGSVEVGGRRFLFGPDVILEYQLGGMVTQVAETPGQWFKHGVDGDEASFYALTDKPHLLRITATGSTSTVAVLPGVHTKVADGAADDLYVGVDSRIYHFDGTSVAEVDEVRSLPFFSEQRAGVARIGPGAAVLMPNQRDGFVWLTPGLPPQTDDFDDSRGAANTLTWIPALDAAVLGSGLLDSFLLFGPGEHRVIPHPSANSPTADAAPLDDGFIDLRRRGLLSHYHREEGWCDTSVQLEGLTGYDAIVPIGDRYLVFGFGPILFEVTATR